MTRPPLPSTRRTVLTTAAWTAPAILAVSAAPAFAVSGIGTMAVLATRGDTGNSIGTIDLTLDPEPLTTPVPVIAYDDPGTTTTSFVKTGTSGTAGLYRLTFTSTTHPCPATITATIDVVGYGTTMPTVLMAAPGTLDTTFADPNLNNPAYGVAVLADGKILATGDFTTAGPDNTPYGRLARFHPDGTLDTTFADPNLNSYVQEIAVQPDGKILATGDFTTAGPDNTPYGRLARFHPDGTLDTTFTNPNLNGIGVGVAVQTDGKIVVTGGFTTAGPDNVLYGRLARFHPDGTLDTTFADPNLNTVGYGVAIQADAKILVTGEFTAAGSDRTRYQRLARFNADGTLDTTFADPRLSNSGFDLAVQIDGKILVSGEFDYVGDLWDTSDRIYRERLARLHPDGTVDTTFANPHLLGIASKVVLRADHSLLTTGYFDAAGFPRTPAQGLARFHSDGTIDATLANPNLNAAGYGVAVDADGKILTTGFFTTAGTGDTTYGHLARFNG